MVRNVHERELPVPAEALGPLLDRVGGPDDPLWPSPAWMPMILDGPLEALPTGGHGPIRYRVTAYEPGRRIEFTFLPDGDAVGTHVLSVEPAGPGRSVLRHVLDVRATGLMHLMWPLAVRWAHDAVVEELLDRAELVLGSGPARPARRSPWARVLQRLMVPRARATEPVDSPLLRRALPRVDWSDAQELSLRPGMPADPQVWADLLFGTARSGPSTLMAVRDRLVRLIGIAPNERAAFTVSDRSDDEVAVGSDAAHLDFRAIVHTEPDRVVVSTVVQLHNLRGRLYFAVVALVHPFVVRAMLNRAALSVSRSSKPRAAAPSIMGA